MGTILKEKKGKDSRLSTAHFFNLFIFRPEWNFCFSQGRPHFTSNSDVRWRFFLVVYTILAYSEKEESGFEVISLSLSINIISYFSFFCKVYLLWNFYRYDMYQDGFFVISMLPIAPTTQRPCRTRTDISSFQDYLLMILLQPSSKWLGWLDSNQRQRKHGRVKAGCVEPLRHTPIWSHEVGSNHQPFDYKSKALTD